MTSWSPSRGGDVVNRIPSYWLVTAQLVCLLFLLATRPFVFARPWLGLEMAGLGVGLWALAAMRRSRLRIRPEPHPESVLIKHGPYRWVRHPMYTAVLLVAGGWVGYAPTGGRVLAGAALVVVLLLKIRREEQLLAEKFPDYAAYRTTTWRLLPPIW